MKKIITFLLLFFILIIGNLYSSMMSFAMQTEMHKQMMWKMKMDCCDDLEKDNWCNDCCILADTDLNSNNINLSNYKKILKIKLISFVDIFSTSSNFLENKNLIKNTSPPNYKQKIKFYSYSDLIKIIKSNT